MKAIEKKLLKVIWQEKKITAKDLSERLGVSLRSIGNYIRNICHTTDIH